MRKKEKKSPYNRNKTADKAVNLLFTTFAVQQQKLFGACFWDGYLLVLEWDLALLLQLFMWLRYIRWYPQFVSCFLYSLRSIYFSVEVFSIYLNPLAFVGLTSSCTRCFWGLNPNCNMSWTHGFSLYWNSSQGNSWLVWNVK